MVSFGRLFCRGSTLRGESPCCLECWAFGCIFTTAVRALSVPVWLKCMTGESPQTWGWLALFWHSFSKCYRARTPVWCQRLGQERALLPSHLWPPPPRRLRASVLPLSKPVSPPTPSWPMCTSTVVWPSCPCCSPRASIASSTTSTGEVIVLACLSFVCLMCTCKGGVGLAARRAVECRKSDPIRHCEIVPFPYWTGTPETSLV